MHLKAILLLALGQLVALATAKFDYVRVNKTDVALLIVDHQVGLFQLVRDWTTEEFRNNVYFHAALGVVFNLPTIITTSAEETPNGPTPKEIYDMHPNAVVIKRKGEINAWDSKEFRAAIRATGKKQFIVAGVTTDACTAFLSLSLVAEGYDVFANGDASGAMTRRIADDANTRMRNAGVQILSGFALAGELMRDWRNTPGTAEVVPLLSQYVPSFSWLAQAHVAAVAQGGK